MGETPAWGTPDRDETDRDETTAAPAYGSAPYGTAPYGTAPSGPVPVDPFALPEFAVVERGGGFFSDGYYDLVAPDETPLARLTKEPGRFFSSRQEFTLTAPDGRVLARVEDPGGWGATRFHVVDAGGRPIGVLLDEKPFWGPRRLVLGGADGTSAQLTGGGLGSGGVRTLTDPADVPMGEVTKQFGWGAFFGGTDIYHVRLAPGLAGPLRVLAVLAIMCVDLIEKPGGPPPQQQRRQLHLLTNHAGRGHLRGDRALPHQVQDRGEVFVQLGPVLLRPPGAAARLSSAWRSRATSPPWGWTPTRSTAASWTPSWPERRRT